MAGCCAQSREQKEAFGDKTPAGTKAGVSLPLWGVGVEVLVDPFYPVGMSSPGQDPKLLIADPSELGRPWGGPLYGG